MSYPIKDVEGIGPAYAEKLAKAGITTTKGLLDRCAGRAGRKQVGETTGISETLLLKWANQADLMRISGIGPQFSELLERAGVDTIKELRHRKAANLTQKLAEVQQSKGVSGTAPSESQVSAWISAAAATEPLISH